MTTARPTVRRVRAFLADPEAPNPGNPIHSGSGAREFGYRAALVGGVNVYGFAVPAIIEALGMEWLDHGWAEVEFRRPVYPDELLEVVIEESGALEVRGPSGDVRLRGRIGLGNAPWIAALHAPTRVSPESAADPLPPLTPENVPVGRDLRARALTLTPEVALAFCLEKQGEVLPCFSGSGARAHPAWLASQPIHLLHHSYSYGPAVHTASRIQHCAPILVGADLVIAGRCVEAFARKGHEYIVNDVGILGATGDLLALFRHTAIYRLAPQSGGRS